MTIQQMIDSHRKAEEAQRKQADAHRENDLKRIEQIINKQLGSMADELQVEQLVGTLTEDGCAYSSLVLTARLKTWEPGVHTFEILWKGEGHFGGKPSGPVAFGKVDGVGRNIVIAPESMDRVAAFLSDEQAKYDERLPNWRSKCDLERQNRIQQLCRQLDCQHPENLVRNEEVATAALASLLELDPENEERWHTLYTDWEEGRVRLLAEERKLEERTAAYLQAHNDWINAYDETVEANQAALAQLQDELDKEFTTWTLTYAVVGLSAENTYTESVEVRSDTPLVGDKWLVLSQHGGHVSHHRFFHLVRVSGPNVRLVADGLFTPFISIPEPIDSWLYYRRDENEKEVQALVNERLSPYPEEPDPADFDLTPEIARSAIERSQLWL